MSTHGHRVQDRFQHLKWNVSMSGGVCRWCELRILLGGTCGDRRAVWTHLAPFYLRATCHFSSQEEQWCSRALRHKTGGNTIWEGLGSNLCVNWRRMVPSTFLMVTDTRTHQIIFGTAAQYDLTLCFDIPLREICTSTLLSPWWGALFKYSLMIPNFSASLQCLKPAWALRQWSSFFI